MRRWSFGQGARLAEAVDDDVLIFVYKEEYLDEVDYLRVYARRLRDKLGGDPEKPCHIRTERGLGCRFLRPA